MQGDLTPGGFCSDASPQRRGARTPGGALRVSTAPVHPCSLTGKLFTHFFSKAC